MATKLIRKPSLVGEDSKPVHHVTVVGHQFGTLLGGAVLTETVFGWPGLGQLLVDALFARDYPVVQGIVLTFSALFILVNLAVDVLYGVIDPRIQYA